MPELPCPDCSAVGDTEGPDPQLQHDASCPVGGAQGAVMRSDQKYFRDHPDQTVFEREVVPLEFAPERLADPPFGYVWRVRVRHIGPGSSTRQPVLVAIFGRK